MTSNRSAKKQGGRKLPATIAREDQILTILREREGFPISTKELASMLGTKTVHFGHCRTCSCPSETKEIPVSNDDIAVILRRFFKAGVIERMKIPGFASAYWYMTQEALHE